MICSIHQPDFLPYLGYFYKMSQSDVFVFLNDAQYSKGDHHEYNEIVKPDGTRVSIKVPIQYHFPCPMTEVKIKGQEWLLKLIDQIEKCYPETRGIERDTVYRLIRTITKTATSLAAMNLVINTVIARWFGINCTIHSSSTLGITTKSNQRLIDICKAVGADTYLSGTGARAYLDEDMFRRNRIDVVYSDYEPVPYPQQVKGEFVPNLSVIDFIMNNGYDFARYYGRR